jgi:serine/threonine-protein kinase
LWAQEYERDVADVLQLEGEIARAIASRIRIELTANETRRLAGRRINPEAQQAYLRGRYYSYNMTDHDQLESIRNFEEAIRLQPDFGAAYAGVAFGWITRFDLGFAPFNEAEPAAREAATKATQLVPDLPDGHTTLADLSWFDWNWKAAEPEFRRAIELDPNYLDARNDYSYFLIIQGRLPEAIAQIERAAALDPFSPLVHVTFGLALARSRRYPEARQHFERVYELDPQSPIALRNLAGVAEQTGDFEKTLSLIEQQLRARGGDILQVPQAGRVYAKQGRRADAQQVLANVTRPGSQATAWQVASLYFALGDKDGGFEWLTKAFDRREVVLLLKTDPLFDSIHSDPRFQALLRRLGVPD